MAPNEAEDGTAASQSSARMGMAIRWLGIVAALSLLLAVVGPRLEDSLPKGISMQRQGTGKALFSPNFEGLFRTNAISLPKRPGEQRVAFVGNSALARAHFAEALRAAVAAKNPAALTYGLAWPGLNALGQGLFVQRAAVEEVDLLLWAISPVDSFVTFPGVFREASPLSLSLGTGVGSALENFRYLARDNGYIILPNLLGAVFPHVRYGSALAELMPLLPAIRLPKIVATSDGSEAPSQPPATPVFANRPPAAALQNLEASLPLLRARHTRLTLLVMPHNNPVAWFGAGQLQTFVGELRRWAQANDVDLIDLSELLPDSAFMDGVHFRSQYDGEVAAAIADSLTLRGAR